MVANQTIFYENGAIWTNLTFSTNTNFGGSNGSFAVVYWTFNELTLSWYAEGTNGTYYPDSECQFNGNHKYKYIAIS